jgi:site-specific DNA recombinase
MDRVRDMVAAGGVSVVLAQDRDRFAREPAYHYLLKREFEEQGAKIRALNDRGDETPEGGAHRRHPRSTRQVRAN